MKRKNPGNENPNKSCETKKKIKTKKASKAEKGQTYYCDLRM